MKLYELNSLLLEAGTSPYSIHKTSVDDAKEFMKSLMKKHGKDENEKQYVDYFSTFEKQYKKIKKELGKYGEWARKDMPVIKTSDVKKLQSMLKTGKLDIYHVKGEEKLDKKRKRGKDLISKKKKTLKLDFRVNAKNPKEFVSDSGKRDHHEYDDIVKSKAGRTSVKDLHPLQEEVNLINADGTIKFGPDATVSVLQQAETIIISKDNFILDGHHRWMQLMLADETSKVKTLKIMLDAEELLQVLLPYGDGIGNPRNLQ